MSLVSKVFWGVFLVLLILNLNSFNQTPFLLTGSESGFKTESENYRAKIYHTIKQMYQWGVFDSFHWQVNVINLYSTYNEWAYFFQL